MRVLVVGVSTRAAAESAARAGFQVTAIDAFGDLDQHLDVHSLSPQRALGAPFSARAVARAARGVECDAVAYFSNFENHPSVIRSLAAGRALWGNTPDVLRRVRNPTLLTQALRQRGLAAPAVRLSDPNDANDWLLKPLHSGGGRRVRAWRRGTRIPRGCYLQEFVRGTPGSVVFVAARGRAVPLAVSRQLIGEASFGATGFQYCGNILAPAGDSQFASDDLLVPTASEMAQAVSQEFGLVGVNGVDFVARDGIPHAIEVNPRWSASMELVERAFGLSVFSAHAAACDAGRLPDFDLMSARGSIDAVGRAVVFARHDVTMGDTRGWLEESSVRDVPHPGEHISAGHPVCTVFARGPDSAACHTALVRRAEQIYAELAARAQAVA